MSPVQALPLLCFSPLLFPDIMTSLIFFFSAFSETLPLPSPHFRPSLSLFFFSLSLANALHCTTFCHSEAHVFLLFFSYSSIYCAFSLLSSVTYLTTDVIPLTSCSFPLSTGLQLASEIPWEALIHRFLCYFVSVLFMCFC